MGVGGCGGGQPAGGWNCAAQVWPAGMLYHASAGIVSTWFGNTQYGHGMALAEAIDQGAVILMRGHGFCTVGVDIPEAVFRAYYTQLNADLQQRAIALGGSVAYLSAEEAAQATATNRSVMARPWGLWKARFAPT